MAEKSTIGDPFVLNVQKWVNKKFKGCSGYTEITENGLVGWNTIYALLHGLQITLNVGSTANNFGNGTIRAFNSFVNSNGKIQERTASQDELLKEKCEEATGTEKENLEKLIDQYEKINGIIQGALLCKGYSIGTNAPTGNFYSGTAKAIKNLREDAGLDSTSSVVTVNIMKALLSMNYFYSYDNSDKTKNIQKIQRYLNANYEDYVGLIPCDGIYNRNTNKALIYAIQVEEKIPYGTANGYFGVSTRRCCPTIPYNDVEQSYVGNKYTSSEIQRFTKLLNMGLYVNGIGDGSFDSSINSNFVKDFQKKYALPNTGNVDLTTWLSIFISCGDESRSAKACDCATILTKEKAKTLYDNGYRYVGRYLSGTTTSGESKALTREELQIAFDQMLNVFPIYQSSANKVSYFDKTKAIDDATNSLYYANKLGIPTGTTIYYAVDCDPLDSEIKSNIIPYFENLSKYMKSYEVGIYGTRNVCSQIISLGYAKKCFVSDMSTGFSGNLGFSIPEKWAFDQFATITIGTDIGQIEIDKDGFSGLDTGISYMMESPLEKVINNIQTIYDKAMDYTNNDKDLSNKLTLQYLRKDSYSDTFWPIVAGPIDDNFCNIIDTLYKNMNFTFYDPVNDANNVRIKYDIAHLAATLNALIFNCIGAEENLDTLSDLYAGWAGDALSFTNNISKAKDSGVTDLLTWANQNICNLKVESKFSYSDYLADIDALNIANSINSGLSLPIAFASYFKNLFNIKIDAEKRTSKWLSRMDTNYLEETCELLKSDNLKIYAQLLGQTDNVKKEYISIALDAFKNFAYKEYVEGR